MKRLCVVLLCLLMMAGLCGCGGTPSELAIYSRVIRKYKLLSYANNFLGGSAYHPVHNYALHDIDGNGISELLVSGNPTGDSSIIGFLIVFTIQNKKAVRQEILAPRYGSYELFQSGTIKTVNFEMDWIDYYRFEGDELRHQVCVLDENEYYEWFLRTQSVDPHFPPYTLIDPEERTPLTKEEFEQLRIGMEGDGQLAEIDWRPLR